MREHPAEAAHAAAAAPPVAAGGSSQRAQTAALGVFGAPGSKDHYGWVALARRQSGSWEPHFNGYAISDTSLPPSGTILSAKIMLPVWSEPQAGANDQSKLQSRLPSRACVRVVSTRGGSGRLWAEVAPASCSSAQAYRGYCRLADIEQATRSRASQMLDTPRTRTHSANLRMVPRMQALITRLRSMRASRSAWTNEDSGTQLFLSNIVSSVAAG